MPFAKVLTTDEKIDLILERTELSPKMALEGLKKWVLANGYELSQMQFECPDCHCQSTVAFWSSYGGDSIESLSARQRFEHAPSCKRAERVDIVHTSYLAKEK